MKCWFHPEARIEFLESVIYYESQQIVVGWATLLPMLLITSKHELHLRRLWPKRQAFQRVTPVVRNAQIQSPV